MYAPVWGSAAHAVPHFPVRRPAAHAQLSVFAVSLCIHSISCNRSSGMGWAGADGCWTRTVQRSVDAEFEMQTVKCLTDGVQS